MNFHLFSLGNSFLFFIFGISGTIFVITLSKIIILFEQTREKTFYVLDMLKIVGKNSLGIMVLHYPPFQFMYYGKAICIYLGITNGLLQFILTMIWVICVCNLLIYLIKANKLL